MAVFAVIFVHCNARVDVINNIMVMRNIVMTTRRIMNFTGKLRRAVASKIKMTKKNKKKTEKVPTPIPNILRKRSEKQSKQ